MDSHSHVDQDDSGRHKPGYIAILAVAAIGILGIGVLVKPEKLEESPVSLSETSPIQALSRRIEFQDMADFLSGRVTAIAPHLVYLDQQGSSAIAWAAPDSFLIAGHEDSPVLVVRRPADSALIPVVRTPPGRIERRGWAIVAARRPDGTLVSTVGMSGGETSLRCGDRVYKELVLSTPLGESFQGGGIFDLEGNLIGVVGRCGEHLAALSAAEIGTALTAGASQEAEVLRAYGLRVTTLDQPAQRYFAVDSGGLVNEIVLGSPADKAGLRPGDVIVSVDSVPIRVPKDLADLLLRDPPTRRTLALVRDGRPNKASLASRVISSGTLFGLDLAPGTEGLALSEVEPGSVAERTGLRAGDRILRIGRLQPRTPELARKALEGAGDRPLYLVYRRENTERGVLLH